MVEEELEVAVDGCGAEGWRGETGRLKGASNDDRPSISSL